MIHDEDKIEAAADKFRDNEDWIRNKWPNMSYGEGVRAALEWILEGQTDEEFMGELPD